MKKQYQNPMFDLISVNLSDIISTSLAVNGGTPNIGEEADIIEFDP